MFNTIPKEEKKKRRNLATHHPYGVSLLPARVKIARVISLEIARAIIVGGRRNRPVGRTAFKGYAFQHPSLWHG
jgi:hypothetical protein